ncbi:MAG: winged helix-turn-helix transcriptional regulator [Thermoflexales bacterium]|nr:winged helix-turn-helix transcriptional regulator [Thermoflexales bacterium]
MADHFKPLEQDAWGGFLGTYARFNRLIEADLQAYSRLTHVEFEVLLRLSWTDDHRLRIQDLTAQSILTQSGMSRAVERLEKAGLVTRESASEDRRGAYAVLTAAGLERFNTAIQAHVAFVREHFLRHFNEAELQQMAEFWHRLEASQD